jgi:hypothetical protein
VRRSVSDVLAFSTKKPYEIPSKVKKDAITFRRRPVARILKEALYRASSNHFLMPHVRVEWQG